MSSKTPVSILQEMMARIGQPPKYDLIYDGSGTHEALFKYKVYANGITAIGSGRSKKQAKQEAAESALERLAEHQIQDSAPVPPEVMEVISPYKDNLHENAIGALHDFCGLHEIPMPKYDLIRVEGQPHARTFTFVCCISKQKELGVGRTKKQAKQQAANNMLNRLKQLMEQKDEAFQFNEESGGDGDGEEEVNGFKEAINKYQSLVGSPMKKLKLNENPALYHKYLTHTDKEVVDIIQQMKLPKFETTKQYIEKKEIVFKEDWVSILTDLVPKLNLTTTFLPMNIKKKASFWCPPSKDKDVNASTDSDINEDDDEDCDDDLNADLYSSMKIGEDVNTTEDAAKDDEEACKKYKVMLLISTVPEAAVPGHGSTQEEAHQVTALKALQFLQVMTK